MVDSLHTERRSFSNLLPRLLFWCLLSLMFPLLLLRSLRSPPLSSSFLLSAPLWSFLSHVFPYLFTPLSHPLPPLCSASPCSLLLLSFFLFRPFPILLSFPLPFSLCPLCLSSPVPLQRDCSQNPLTFIPRRRYITILKTLSCVKGNPASDRSRCLQGFTLIWPRLGRPACLVFMRLMRSWKPFVEMLHKAAAVE